MQGSDVEEMVLCAEFGDWSLEIREYRKILGRHADVYHVKDGIFLR